jgi:GTPase SAR1 family protein
MPTYIEVRDKGVVKKKIPLKSKSYDDVALELRKYFRYLGKRLAPNVLENVLDHIGLPKARKILVESEPESEPLIEEEPLVVERPTEPEQKLVAVEEPIKKGEGPAKKVEKKKEKKKTKVKSTESPGASANKSGIITADDFDDIADALQAVEALSDSFMTPSGKEPVKEASKPKLRINLKGEEEIISSGTSYARTPGEEIAKSQIASGESDIVELVAETVEEDREHEPMIEEEPTPIVTPTHQIKPIIDCKVLLLGEAGVGKRTLKDKAGVKPSIANEDTGEVSPYIFTKIVDGVNHRINLNVWSFDLAVKAKLPRQKFYDDAQLLIIVYAASDRWSFESLDFWLRESSITCEITPPTVIVGNKTDLRLEAGDDSGEDPVSYNEGFQYAEDLAKKLGMDGKLHPVAFIETSSLTGENTEEVFKTAANLYENSL